MPGVGRHLRKEEKRQRRRCEVHPDGLFRKLWDGTQVVFVIYVVSSREPVLAVCGGAVVAIGAAH
eukprot:COSAG02_NODE_28627_length_586_cov_0.618070_2_plen_64_part_01